MLGADYTEVGKTPLERRHLYVPPTPSPEEDEDHEEGGGRP